MVRSFIIAAVLLALVSCKSKGNDHIVDLVLHGDNHILNKEAKEDFEKGLSLIEEKQYGSARKYFKKADQLCPGMPVILNAIGNCFSESNRPDSAVPYYERSLMIDSSFTNTYLNFGCCLNNMRQYDRAMHIVYRGLTRASSRTDRRAGFLILANSYYFEKENKKALVLLDSVKANAPHDLLYEQAVRMGMMLSQQAPPHALPRPRS